MSDNNPKKIFNERMSSGWQRIIITTLGTITSLFFLYTGYLIIKSGVSGDWKIVSNFKGLELYAASISPGLFIIICGTFIFYYMLKILSKIR